MFNEALECNMFLNEEYGIKVGQMQLLFCVKIDSSEISSVSHSKFSPSSKPLINSISSPSYKSSYKEVDIAPNIPSSRKVRINVYLIVEY